MQFLFPVTLFTLLYIIRTSILVQGQEEDVEFYHPRVERRRSMTSGEEASLQSKIHSSSNDETPTYFSTTTQEKDIIIQDARNPSKPQQQPNPTTTTTNVHQDKTKKHHHSNKMIVESEALSNPYGLNSTTNIDPTTLAQLFNAASEYDGIHRSHHTVHHQQDHHIYDEKARWEANYFLGLIYLYDLVPQNYDRNRHKNRNNHKHDKDRLSEAMRYLTVAANGGHADAQCAVGVMYYHGYNCYYVGQNSNNQKYTKCQIQKQQHQQKAISWFYKASTHHNHPRGHWLLGQAIYHGWSYHVDPDTRKLHIWKRDSTTQSSSSSSSSNMMEAARLFSLAANYNISDAIHHLALLHEYNLIPPSYDLLQTTTTITTTTTTTFTDSNSNPLHDTSFTKRQDNNNHTNNLDSKYINYQKAMTLYKQAYELHRSPQSSYNIALMYAYGRGVRTNVVLATEWFRKGAVLFEHAPSMRYLGILAIHPNGCFVGSSRSSSSGSGSEEDDDDVDDAYMEIGGITNYETAWGWLDQCAQTSHDPYNSNDEIHSHENTNNYDNTGEEILHYWREKCEIERDLIGQALQLGREGKMNQLKQLQNIMSV